MAENVVVVVVVVVLLLLVVVVVVDLVVVVVVDLVVVVELVVVVVVAAAAGMVCSKWMVSGLAVWCSSCDYIWQKLSQINWRKKNQTHHSFTERRVMRTKTSFSTKNLE